MKTIITIFVSFLFSSSIIAQNIVPNYSFEEYDTCLHVYVIPGPFQLSIYNNGLKYWINPTAATPDYDNICESIYGYSYSVPQNMFGYQFARTGNAYIDLDVFTTTPTLINFREYIEVKLTDSLIAGKKYCASFFVSLADSSNFAVDNMGLYFSDTLISDSSYHNLPYIPQIQNPIGNFLSDEKNWVLISGEYTAHGGEKYITIGNFYSDANTDTINITGGSHILEQESMYYIDDVSVMDCSDTTGIKEINEDNSISVYPNPANDNVTVVLSNVDNGKCIFELFDAIGNIVFSKEFVANQNSITIPLDNVAKGVYICRIINSNNIKLYNNKLVIIK